MRDKEIQTLITALRAAREQHYLSIKGMAQRMGFSSGHLSMVLAGKRKPSMRFMEAAVQAFPEVRLSLRESLDDDTSGEQSQTEAGAERGPPVGG